MDNFLKRIAYYASELVANQAEPGDWDYDVKPTYVIALARYRIFENDERIVHRASTLDLETGEQIVDSYNYTIIELAKVPFFIGKDSLSKWLFFFRYLSRLRELPPELSDKKFKQLTESAKVSKFSKKEFEAYQKMYHERWDHNVLKRGFFKEFAMEINAEIAKNVSGNKREIAKKLKARNRPVEEIAEDTGLSIEEINALQFRIQILSSDIAQNDAKRKMPRQAGHDKAVGVLSFPNIQTFLDADFFFAEQAVELAAEQRDSGDGAQGYNRDCDVGDSGLVDCGAAEKSQHQDNPPVDCENHKRVAGNVSQDSLENADGRKVRNLACKQERGN